MMILNYRPYRETSFKNLFIKGNWKKSIFLTYGNLEYYCCIFRKVCYCICPLNFIQTSKLDLITWTIRICVCANIYWKCVNNKCLRVFTLFSPSPVTESCQKIWVQRKLLFHVLHDLMASRKFLVQTAKWSASP